MASAENSHAYQESTHKYFQLLTAYFVSDIHGNGTFFYNIFLISILCI